MDLANGALLQEETFVEIASVIENGFEADAAIGLGWTGISCQTKARSG